ncbi:MAG: DUF58 domain-containing protein [Nitrososphaeria archaeon]|jgi:uncharacterized protein (DUF58 family)
MLSSDVPQLVWKAFALVLLGMIFLNTLFVWFALVYLLFLVLALAIEQPKSVHIQRVGGEIKAYVNDVIKLEEHVTVGEGRGIVTVADKLPEHFELESDEEDYHKNFRVFWKGEGTLSEDMSYNVKLTRRGNYDIGPPIYESLHTANLRQVEVGFGSDPLKLVVRHRPINVRKLRDPNVLSQIPMPLGAMTLFGVRTNEFIELREYKHGDPYSRINWKATARLSCRRPNSTPLVNDYESEGKKTVWFFLDSSMNMRIGTEIDNAFEYAIKAISGLSQFYLSKNCRVALNVYNCGKTILPDTGRRQEYKIARELERVEINELHGTLRQAIEDNKWHLVGQNPLFIVVTMVRKENLRELLQGIKSMRLYSTVGRAQIIIIHVMGYDIAARGSFEEAGARMLDLSNLALLRSLRRAGAFVVPWNTKTQIILKPMLARARIR